MLEIAYGLASVEAVRETALPWFTRLVTGDLVLTLAFDAVSAVVAGRVRAAHPLPPTGVRRSGTKPGQRAGWVLDIQIAACAWARGHALATHNRQDFAVVADLIGHLYPTVPTLEVVDPPAL